MRLLLGLLIALPTLAIADTIRIEGLDQLGIKYEAHRQSFEPRSSKADIEGRDQSDNHLLRVTLKDLSQKQYDDLSRILPGRPTFEKGRRRPPT